MFFNLVYPNFNFAHKYDEKPIINDEFRDHYHMIYELLFFVSGSAQYIIENQKIELVPGDLLFITPGQHHSINVAPTEPYERYVIKFPEYEIPKKLLPMIKSKAGNYSTVGTHIPELFTRLDIHVESYVGVDLCGLLKCVLQEILYYSFNESTLHDSEAYNENMIEVIKFINENIARKLTIDDICNYFHYSKSYICKEFQQCMRVPIMQYVRTKKVLLADALIKSGIKPVAIFEQCGFSDYSTFYRAYKKILGTNPSLSMKNDK